MSSRLLSNKYYFENSAGIILSPEGRAVIEAEIEKHKPKCAKCGEGLILITMMEGDFVICPVDMYAHENNWIVSHDPMHIEPPTLYIKGKKDE